MIFYFFVIVRKYLMTKTIMKHLDPPTRLLEKRTCHQVEKMGKSLGTKPSGKVRERMRCMFLHVNFCIRLPGWMLLTLMLVLCSQGPGLQKKTKLQRKYLTDKRAQVKKGSMSDLDFGVCIWVYGCCVFLCSYRFPCVCEFVSV